MGNCIFIEKKPMMNNINVLYTSSSAEEKIRMHISNEGKIVFLTDSKPGVPVCKKMAPKSDLGSHEITFSLTKKQWAELVYSSTNGVEELGSVSELAFRFMVNFQAREERRKWRPSLVTILE